MEKFYIGLDIGTNTCGGAATDENYKLLKYHGQDMWVVRLFPEAQAAEKRRTQRTSRRRLARRKNRIGLLQELFADEMAKVDNTFFIKLNSSAYRLEDKAAGLGKYTLFNDETFTDIDFYKEYPTIYHLRRKLMSGEITDIRLLYLALHHIIKYRGNFLFEGQNFSEITDIVKIIEEINCLIEDNFPDMALCLNTDNLDELKEYIIQTRENFTKTKAKISSFLASKKEQDEFIKAVCGGKFTLSKLLINDVYKDSEHNSVCFSDADFDASIESIRAEITEYEFDFLCGLKKLYDYITLSRVLRGREYLSDAMIEIYNKHAADLKKLKKLIRVNYSRETYNYVFRSCAEKANYCNYIGGAKVSDKDIHATSCKKEDFYKFISAALEKKKAENCNNEDYISIMSDIEAGNFMPKILNADSGVFPYQINEVELVKILEIAREKFAFLNNEEIIGENCWSVVDKIHSLLTFRIPYYVGVLNDAHKDKPNGHAWIERLSRGKVTPWNYSLMVNEDESAENFIRRMTNKCSYLVGEDVLPKNSILYSKFNVLNQINKLKINDESISVALKQRIYNDLFLNNKKVTNNKIVKYLIKEGYAQTSVTISGADGDFDCNMGAYITLRGIIGDLIETREDIAENIILWHTLFTDKKLVARKIMQEYSNISVVMENIDALKSLRFSDFGRLSREFLANTFCNSVEQTEKSIIDLLYETNQNLNELLYNGKYKFTDIISQKNNFIKSAEIKYSDVEDMYVSPAVKRGVWQAIGIVKEYVKAVGHVPDKIFVEVTRHDGEKVRTASRKNILLNLYRKCKGDSAEISHFIEDINRRTDADLRQERLYLYYTQRGKCMYTGEKIDLGLLNDSKIYDIDHIIPQSMTKDDSFDNRVLVKRDLNKAKTDTYPLDINIIKNNEKFWKELETQGLITKAKYARLIKTELTAADFEGFIARQIVFTNQAAKAIAQLLCAYYPDTEIVYSKAANVSEFRQKFNIIKCRDTNDLHHAVDAYLNIVVGNVYNTKFGHDPRSYFMQRDTQRKYNLKTMYDYDIPKAWDRAKTLNFVKNTVLKNSMKITQMSYCGKGLFYDETVYSGEKALFPRKAIGVLSDVKKYGGYSSLKAAYFMVVDSLDKKKNSIRTIEAVPVIFDYLYKGDLEKLTKMSEDYLGLIKPTIVFPKIKIKSLLKINGSYAYLGGKTNDSYVLHNANQWFTSGAQQKYYKLLSKFVGLVDLGAISKDNIATINLYEVSPSNNSTRKDFISKDENLARYNEIIEQFNKPFYYGISAFDKIRTTLHELYNNFVELGLLEQSKFLLSIIKGLRCNAEKMDYSLAGGCSMGGTLKIGKNITNQNIILCNQSISGIYENHIILNKGKE